VGFLNLAGGYFRFSLWLMAEMGRMNVLEVLESSPNGVYLEGGAYQKILLPTRYVPRGTELGTRLEVFVYRDSEDRVIATTERPRVMVGEFGVLQVVGVHRRAGAFLDWGLSKDLLLPYQEMDGQVQVGERVVVHVMIDPRSDRIIASRKLEGRKPPETPRVRAGDAVRLMIARKTPLGFVAVFGAGHSGLLHHDGAQAAGLAVGDEVDGYVAAIRPDGKMDLSLNAAGYQRVAPLTEQILARLAAADGALPLDDDSSPEAIRAAFGVSKKAFKQALGALLKNGQIRFTQPGICRRLKA
jgi:predicted RNA-binding protein (virulence factor B family)